MKRLIVSLLFLTLLCIGGQAHAQGTGEFEFGMEFAHFEYEEPNFMEEEGFFWGFFGNYTHRVMENQPLESWGDIFGSGNAFNVFELDARVMFGEVDYTSNGTGSLDGIDDFLFEIRGVAGYDIPVFENSRITPYFGFGYRYLNDDSGGLRTTTGAAGYEREANYFYMPFGVEWFTPFDGGWSVTATAEFDLFIDGEQKSHLGDAISGLNTVKNDQDDGKGFRGSIKIAKETERVDFFVEPYVRYWDIEDSEVSPITFSGVLVGFGLEPKNDSLETGARVGINF